MPLINTLTLEVITFPITLRHRTTGMVHTLVGGKEPESRMGVGRLWDSKNAVFVPGSFGLSYTYDDILK